MEPAAEWMMHLARMSGKVVVASTSITPQAWLAASPFMVQPMDLRTLERAPSQPTTYLARTVRWVAASGPAVRSRVTATGYSAHSSISRPWKSQP